MNGLGFKFNINSQIFRLWQDSASRVAKTALDLPSVIEKLEIESVKTVGRDIDMKISQTGYCHTTLANTIGFAANALWLKKALSSENVSCVFTNQKALDQCGVDVNKPLIISERAAEYFHLLHNQGIHAQCYLDEPSEQIVSASANVDDSVILRGAVFIDDDVSIGPLSVITGPAYIGPGTRIEEMCTIGSRGIFVKRVESALLEFKYYGGVAIGVNSHLHARSNVAKAPHFLSYTQIGSNVSIGISANIGHDCILYDNSTVASTACVCGRGIVRENAWIGAGAIVSDPKTVHANSRVRIGAVVVEDVEPDGDVSGNFAIDHKKTIRNYIRQK